MFDVVRRVAVGVMISHSTLIVRPPRTIGNPVFTRLLSSTSSGGDAKLPARPEARQAALNARDV